MVQAIELGDSRGSFRIVLTELRLGLTFLVAPLKKIVPLVNICEWIHCIQCHRLTAHNMKLHSLRSVQQSPLIHVTANDTGKTRIVQV
jgi:hypothetical protein